MVDDSTGVTIYHHLSSRIEMIRIIKFHDPSATLKLGTKYVRALPDLQ